MKVKLEFTLPDKYIGSDLEMFAAMVAASIGDSTHLKRDAIKCIVKNCVKVVPEKTQRDEMLDKLYYYVCNDRKEVPDLLDKLLAYKGQGRINASDSVDGIIMWEPVQSYTYSRFNGSNIMNTTRFIVEIVTSDKIVDDQCKNEMAQNIANAIIHEVNHGMGIVPELSDGYTEIVYVKEWYSDKQIIEHPL